MKNKVAIPEGPYYLVTEKWEIERAPLLKRMEHKKEPRLPEALTEMGEHWGVTDLSIVEFPSKVAHLPAIGVTFADWLFKDLPLGSNELRKPDHANPPKYTPLVIAKKSSLTPSEPESWLYATHMMVPYPYASEKKGHLSHQAAATSDFPAALEHEKLVAFINFENTDEDTKYAFLCTSEEDIGKKIAQLPGFEECDQGYRDTLPFLAKFWVASRFNPGAYTLSREKLEELIATFREQLQDTSRMPSASGAEATLSASAREPQRKTRKRKIFQIEADKNSEDEEREKEALHPFLETGYDVKFLKGRPNEYQKDILELLKNPPQHISQSKKGKNDAIKATADPLSLPPTICADSQVKPVPCGIMARRASLSLPISALTSNILLPLSTTGSQSPIRPMATVEPFSQTTPPRTRKSRAQRKQTLRHNPSRLQRIPLPQALLPKTL